MVKKCRIISDLPGFEVRSLFIALAKKFEDTLQFYPVELFRATNFMQVSAAGL